MKILITSIGTATSVNIVKMLRGIKNINQESTLLIGTDINPYGYTAGSLLVDHFYTVSSGNSENYLQEIAQIVKQENVDFLWPVNDVEIAAISASELINKVKCIVCPKETAKLVRDKYECSSYVSKVGIQIPRIMPSKMIVRKRQGVGSVGIRDLTMNNDEFTQEYVEGKEFTIDCLCDHNGHPAFIIPRERLQVKSGVSTKCRIVKDDSLISDTKKILGKIQLPFFSNIQFIKANKNNYFIEINPRIGGGSMASILAADGISCLLQKIVFRGEALENGLVLNENVKWGLVMTRYYEEIMYEPK